MTRKDIRVVTESGREFVTDEHGYIRGEVLVDPSDLIERNLEGTLDMFSEALTGSTLLTDIAYTAVRLENGRIVFDVLGDPALILDTPDDGRPGPGA